MDVLINEVSCGVDRNVCTYQRGFMRCGKKWVYLSTRSNAMRIEMDVFINEVSCVVGRNGCTYQRGLMRCGSKWVFSSNIYRDTCVEMVLIIINTRYVEVEVLINDV